MRKIVLRDDLRGRRSFSFLFRMQSTFSTLGLFSYYGNCIYQPNIILKLEFVSFNSYYYKNRKQKQFCFCHIPRNFQETESGWWGSEELADYVLILLLGWRRNRLFAFGERCKELLVQTRYNVTKQTAMFHYNQSHESFWNALFQIFRVMGPPWFFLYIVLASPIRQSLYLHYYFDNDILIYIFFFNLLF